MDINQQEFIIISEIVQSVDRTLSRLETLSDYEEGLGIADISLKLGMHKSTVHRLLNILIHKCKTTSKYSVTFKLFELGSKKVNKLYISSIAKPYLE